MTGPKDSIERFKTNKFTVIKDLIPADLLETAYRYTLLKAGTGQFEARKEDRQVSCSAAQYADPLMEVLLASSMPEIEQATGLTLYPTYSYCRIYKRNAFLCRHVDRPECEVSATVCLGYQGARPSPLYVESSGSAFCCTVYPGDALIYRGMEVVHWREPLQIEQQAQIFLHYVDRCGPYSGLIYDSRPGLGLPPESKGHHCE